MFSQQWWTNMPAKSAAQVKVPIGKVVLQRGKFITKIAGSIGINLDK